MEPLSALGIAAAAVQFIDFATRLLSDTVTKDLGALTSRVEEKAVGLRDDALPDSPDAIFLDNCRQCSEISNELADILETLGARSSRFKLRSARSSLVAAIRGLVSESKVKDLTEKLQTIQRQVGMAAIVSLWEKAQLDGQTVREISQQQLGILSKLQCVDESTKDIASYLNALANPSFLRFFSAEKERLDAIVHNIWSIKQPPRLSDAHALAVDSATHEHEILTSLHFNSIQDREATIPRAYAKTFDWLFEAKPDTVATSSWSSFPAWLEADTREIYWITGKAGAGKSTLMKFITTHERLQQHLTVWSGPDRLLHGSFYFWNAGTGLQKSHEGLMRTLLMDFLEQRPDLIPRVCERRWACLQMLGTESLASMLMWQWDELIECFKALVSESATHHCRLVIFIDGLDEFDGDHTKLIEVIKDLSQYQGVKICVSSRPWNVFNDAFHQNPSLMMQDLTRNDIDRYVIGHFESLPAFNELQSAAPEEAARLLQDTASRADGVFLWVSVVVRTLTERLTAGDKLADLHATLTQLPRDIENLLEAIRRRIDTQHIHHSAQYFLLLLESRRKPCIVPPSAVTFMLADEDEESSLHREFSGITAAKQSWMVSTMRRRLHSRTMGLLEITPSGTVGFLHRTVLEWATRGQTLAKFNQDAPTDFNPNLELFKARTTELINFHPLRHTRAQSPNGSLCQTNNNVITDEKASRFWDLFTVCLRHAALATRSHGTEDNTRLLRLLRKVEGYVDQLSMAEESIRKHPKLSEMLAAQLVAPDRALEATRLRLLSNSQHIFVYLAATFGILPFVMASVDPVSLRDQQSPHDDYFSLLYAAVFGELQLDDMYYTNSTGGKGTIPCLYETRLELVRYLLQLAPRNEGNREVMHELAITADFWRPGKRWLPKERWFLYDVVSLILKRFGVPRWIQRFWRKGPTRRRQEVAENAANRKGLEGGESEENMADDDSFDDETF